MMAANLDPPVTSKVAGITPVAGDLKTERDVRMAEIYLAFLSLIVIVAAFIVAIIVLWHK